MQQIGRFVTGAILVTLVLSLVGMAQSQPGVVFIDQMDSLKDWQGDDSTQLSISRTERKTGNASLYVKYEIDKDNPGTVWFARKNIGIDRLPVGIQVWVNTPFGQRFTWYDFPKLRMIVQDKDGTAMYADIDKLAAHPVYEGGKSLYTPWAQVYFKMKDFFPLWPGKNGKLDGIETVSFELPHRTEDFMKDGDFEMYLDELSVVFDNAEAYINGIIADLKKKNEGYQKELDALPKATWKRYPEATMGVITLFCENAQAEFKEGKVVRAARQLEYLKQLSDEIGKNLALVKQGKAPYANVEPAKYTHLKVKEGTYFDGDRPVYITGFCGGVGADQIKNFKQMGFNGFSGGMGMGSTRPDEKTTTQPAASITEAKFAADNNLAYDILLGLHEAPGWAYAKWPDLDPSCRRRGSAPDAPLSPKNQYMPWNVDHPEFRKLVAEHLKTAVLALKDIPSLASYDICNEMWYLCHGDFDPNAFRARLQQRYKDIGALNKAWGTNFKDFQDVQYQANSAVSTADLYEYNQYRVTEFFRFCTKEVQKYDPKTPVCGKVHGCWRQMIGINKAALMEFFTAADSDVYPRMGNNEENLVADMWTSSMVTQEYRSLAPNKPIIDAEQHMLWYHQIVTEDFIRSLLWWRAILGVDANYAWVWSRGCENAEECIFTQPWAFQSLSRIALDLERLSVPVHQFQQVRPDVLLIEAGAKTPDAYKLCSYSGIAFDLLPREAITPERLKGYQTIVLPVKAKLDDSLRSLVKGSGVKVIELTAKTDLAELCRNIGSKIKPMVRVLPGLVNYMMVDPSGKPMVFLLNLNTDKVKTEISLPEKGSAVDLLNDGKVVAGTIELEPLKPMFIKVQ
jgi:hypothetical protein